MFLQVSVCPQAEGHVWQGGMCGCRGHAWLRGGMHGGRGACMVARGACVGYDEIWSMSGAVHILLECILVLNILIVFGFSGNST